jgi:ComF family protein
MSAELLKRLFSIHKCAACRAILSQAEFDGALCSKCDATYRAALAEGCPSCFRSAIECTCQPKSMSDAGSLCLRKLFFYHPDKENEPQNRLIYFLKHNRSRRAIDFVANEIYGELKNELEALEIDDPHTELLLVNLPRGRKAVAIDGFDQSLELCKAISKISGIPCAPLIRRKRGGKEQKSLNLTERKKNVKKIMLPNERYAEQAKGRYIILVDDIVTTGASMSVCLPILRKMGIKGVISVALALDLKKKKSI